MTTPSTKFITLKDLFEIKPDLVGHDAHKIWTDLIYNRIGWYGWTSWLDEYTHTDINKLSEMFINHHSYLKVGQEHVYTQLPSTSFFFARQIRPTLYVRGAIWSNGALWEEIGESDGRNLTLMMNKLTISTFKYPDPNYNDEDRLIDFRAYMGS